MREVPGERIEVVVVSEKGIPPTTDADRDWKLEDDYEFLLKFPQKIDPDLMLRAFRLAHHYEQEAERLQKAGYGGASSILLLSKRCHTLEAALREAKAISKLHDNDPCACVEEMVVVLNRALTQTGEKP